MTLPPHPQTRTLRVVVATAGLVAVAAALVAQSTVPRPPDLIAIRIVQPPTLDGRGDDLAWSGASPVAVTARGVMPKTKGTSAQVVLRAAYTDTHIYLMVTWDDATRDDQGHRTWTWDAEKKAYIEGADREDMFGVAFEHTGEFVADMMAGVEATWDLWHWKAFRTNPQGYAMDKMHRYTNTQPAGTANKYTATTGRDTWIARPQDAGDTVEVQQPAPTEFKGDRVPRYTTGRPTGSAADVTAKGAWAAGRWTVEFARRLDTGQADDTAFSPARSYRMSVSVHDRTAEMDKAADVIVLSFRK